MRERNAFMDLSKSLRKVILLAGILSVSLLTACGQPSKPADAGATASPRADEIAKASSSSSPGVTSSGSLERDMEKLGIKPDDPKDYIDFLVNHICSQDTLGTEIAVRSIGGGSPAEGKGPDIVRSTARYKCPEKLIVVEKELRFLKKNGY